MRYLLDTDTCMHVLRGNSSVITKMKAIAGDDLAISSISVYELHYGVMRCHSTRRDIELKKVAKFIQHIHIIPFNNISAQIAARIRQLLEQSGQGIGPMDALIAATALEAKLPLVTGNIHEFSRVPELRCEKWN